MTTKYCFTSFSVADLAKTSESYDGFSYEHIIEFGRNISAYEKTDNSEIDVIYVFSRLLQDASELGGIFSGNIIITNDALFGIDKNGDFQKILPNSIIYLLRINSVPSAFLSFLIQYAKKQWNIQVIVAMDDPLAPLATKIHSLLYVGPTGLPPSIVPYICDDADLSYLGKYIYQSGLFGERIIVKKQSFSAGEGIGIFDIDSVTLSENLADFLGDYRKKDYIIMKLIETENIEYRVYWIKKNGQIRIIGVHGKERLAGHILHNISQGNILRRLDDHCLSPELVEQIVDYCKQSRELHGGLDILTSKEGIYYITENNRMVGYLHEPEEIYLTQEWLDAVASCYIL